MFLIDQSLTIRSCPTVRIIFFSSSMSICQTLPFMSKKRAWDRLLQQDSFTCWTLVTTRKNRSLVVGDFDVAVLADANGELVALEWKCGLLGRAAVADSLATFPEMKRSLQRSTLNEGGCLKEQGLPSVTIPCNTSQNGSGGVATIRDGPLVETRRAMFRRNKC